MKSISKLFLFTLCGLFQTFLTSVEMNESNAFENRTPQTVLMSDAKNWGLYEKGIDLKGAWVNQTGRRDVVVAVIDTGIDFSHPQLKSSLWQNPGEVGYWKPKNRLEALAAGDCRDKSCNQMDDDHNGFVDDVVGWDFTRNSPIPQDQHGHGSHIAGIIAGKANQQTKFTGIAPNVSIMVLKYYDERSSGSENLRNTVKAIRYATQMGADIINYSGGGPDPSRDEEEALRKASQKGILLVAAAGNDGKDTSGFAYFPASYPLDNIISVANITTNDSLASSSNYGVKRVHIAAPGTDIYSTLPGNHYGYMTGTSQATAFVTGVAALVLSENRALTAEQIKEVILESVDPVKKLKGLVFANGKVNASSAVAMARKLHTTPKLIADIMHAYKSLSLLAGSV